jgi:hypothetical protein
MPANFTAPHEYDKLVDLYKRAVEQNLGNDKLKAHGEQILVQVMPHFERYGAMFTPTPVGHGYMTIWLRCAVVLDVGSKVKGFKPGEHVIFNTNFGIRYLGDGNPIRVETKRGIDEDQVRFLKTFEIWGKVEFNLTGKVLAYRSIHDRNIGARIRYAEVIEESWLYGGIMKARRADLAEGEEEVFELPYLWLERDESGEPIEQEG